MEKMDNEKVLIIIPVFNEEKNLKQLLEMLHRAEIRQIADYILINDGSTDHSAQILRDAGSPMISHIYNMGYGSALQTGYKYAVRKNYPYVIQMDADGQHDISNVPEIYRQLHTPDANGKNPDIVLGSRYMEGSAPFPTGIFKRIAMAFFRSLIRISTGKTITDPTSGLQGLSHRLVCYYAGYNHFDDKYPDANMLMQMLLLGFQVREIPAVMHPRTEGASMHSGLKPIIYMFRMGFCMLASWGRVKIFHLDVGVADEK